MSQLELILREKDYLPPTAVDVSGFENFYPLLRALVAVMGVDTFYERLRVLLVLSRWQDDPPTVHTLARGLAVSSDALSQTLTILRSAGWLRANEDDRHYALTEQGRILIILLQLLAQPWEEGDITAFATQLYGAADSLGVRRDLLRAQFETVLSTLEERARKVDAALTAEDSQIVSRHLRDSKRDVQIAHKALELRQRGAAAEEDYEQAQRMHMAISQLSNGTAQLDIRFQKLIARDLLAQGLVTLGDILQWARQATLEEATQALLPFLNLPFLSIWSVPENALIESANALAGKTAPTKKNRPSGPVPLGTPPPTTSLDEIKQRIYREQAELRTKLGQNDPVPLSEWVDREEWADAVMRYVAALDPELRHARIPVYLHLNLEGQLDLNLRGAAETVTLGSLSLESGEIHE